MIVEDCGEFPRPLTSRDAGIVQEIIQKGSACGLWDDRGLFNETGEFRMTTKAHGSGLYSLWGSNILQWSANDYRLYCRERFIQVCEKGNLRNIVQTIDPGNFRCVDDFGRHRTTVGSNGFLEFRHIEGKPLHDFQHNFPDCPKKLFTLEEILREADKGKQSPIWGSTMSLVRATDPDLVGSKVTSLKFGYFYSHDPRKIDAVIVSEKRQLLDREIIYPLIDEESYKYLAEGSVPVKYKVARAEELFASIL